MEFSIGVGFYSGEIKLVNGPNVLVIYNLPKLDEYFNKDWLVHNTDITRSERIIHVRLKKYDQQFPVLLFLNLDNNIRDPSLIDKLQVPKTVQIKASLYN